MSIPSNLYAEKVFAEQPVALWALDDDADFVSILSANDRNLSSWTISDASIEQSTDLIKQIKKSPLVKVSTENSTGFTATSPLSVISSSLNQGKPSISVSTYFYSTTDEISNIRVSIINESGDELSFTNYPLSLSNSWVFLSDTYPLPSEDSKIRISVTTEFPGDYDFYINGLSCGQWSEHFSTVSDGIDLVELPSGISVEDTHGYPAYAYGFSDQTGYYLGDNYSLYAYNDGLPLVYGASNVTRITGRSGPSLILPANGFLHDSGKYQDLTLEMWIKIFNRHLEPHRIVGPIGSEDGIYVDGPFLLLKVGPNVQSYFLNELERPMLLGFRMSQYTASLVVNGESVISMDIDVSTISFPVQESENWIGFYGYSDKLSFEIDAVAIYPYKVPEIVSKRRFAYGQAVDVPESINGSLVGSGVTFDYRVSDYANNYIYPDMGNFNQGIIEGLSTDDGVLSTKRYQLPNIIFRNPEIILQDWLDDSYEDEGSSDFSSVDFSLAGSGETQGAYILLDKMSKVSQDVTTVYGIYKASDLTDETLFRIDSPSGAYFLADLKDSQIRYTLSYPNQTAIEMVSDIDLDTEKMFIAGINFEKFSARYGGFATNFVNEIKRCSLYIGGYKTFENMFTGKLYRFGIATKKNSIPISSWSDDYGIISNVEGSAGLLDGGEPDSEYSVIAGGAEPDSSLQETRNGGFPVLSGALEELGYVATYTLAPRYYLGKFVLDIASYGYWQDQIPLSHFGKAIYDLEGNPKNTLNYLQLNVGVPKIDYLDSELEYFDTSNLPVKTYISFQYLSSGANKTDVSIPSRQRIGKVNVVLPGTNWMTTMYEVVSGTVIYPPTGVDYRKLAIVIHMIFETKSTMSNVVRVKRLELASQAMSEYRPTRIGTKFGASVTPFVKRGLYPDYDGVNPVEIYKNSTPYLYLSKHSGLRVLGYQSLYEETKGVSIPINQSRVSQYAVGAIQSFISYQESWVFPEVPVKIMEVKAYNRSTEIWLQADSESFGNRARVYAVDSKTRIADQLVNFYLNGKLVKTPYISPMEWNVLTLQFVDAMRFDSFSGSVDFVGPILFNNVSTYRLSEIQTSITSIFRTWSQVEQFFDKDGNEPTNWGDFLSSNPQTTWENILFIPTIRRYLVDPVSIFQSYTGTNRISVSDSSILSFKNYKYSLYKDLRWKSSIVTPV